MSEAMSPVRAAASVLFNLPEYRVIEAVDRPGGAREVTVEGTWVEAACSTCGVLSTRVHQRTRQRPRDIPVAGPAHSLQVVVLKRRFACDQAGCPRRTFVEVSDQLPARARVTTRLRAAVLDAVVTAGRVLAEVAGTHRVAWWTVQRARAGRDALTR